MDLRITSDVTDEDVEQIHQALRAFNRSRREPSRDVPLGIFLEDEQGNKQAGLTGELFGNWLYVKYLWVSEALRGQGIGSRILAAAEQEARSKGAKYVFLDSFSFQAPEFYKKYGYREVFRLEEYPYTGYRSYFTKTL